MFGIQKMLKNSTKRFIALEGVPFSGKTTLLRYLQSNYSDKFSVIPEAGEYVGGDKNFPKVPFGSYDAAKASTHFFISVEIQRCKDALALSEKQYLPVIFDRCTPFSSLLFYLLLEKKYPHYHKFKESFFLYGLEMFQKAIDEEKIFLPNAIVYLIPGNKQTFLQRISRGASTGIFEKWDTVQFFNKSYNCLLKEYKGNFLKLKSYNKEFNCDNLARQILRYLQKTKIDFSPKKDLNQLFDGKHFLGKYRLKDEIKNYDYMYRRSKELMETSSCIKLNEAL